ncbi:MAG TPA: hypothetical protein VMU36_14335 [Spirochaetia bacterium]|nr:hypothetical protein [Spirochaetia bacterium]
MKNLVMAFLLCLVCAIAPAQAPLHMQAGITFLYDHYNFVDSNRGISASDDRGNLAFGAFFDAIYLRAIVEYQRAISGTIQIAGSSIDYPSSFSISFINALALVKYPFQLGSTTIWPAVGMRYSHPLSYTIGFDALADPTTAVADLYVSFGGGLDFTSGSVVFGLSALFDYNLTPSQTTNTLYPGEQVSSFDLELGLNVGVAL